MKGYVHAVRTEYTGVDKDWQYVAHGHRDGPRRG
jgi:hypothetical protein